MATSRLLPLHSQVKKLDVIGKTKRRRLSTTAKQNEPRKHNSKMEGGVLNTTRNPNEAY